MLQLCKYLESKKVKFDLKTQELGHTLEVYWGRLNFVVVLCLVYALQWANHLNSSLPLDPNGCSISLIQWCGEECINNAKLMMPKIINWSLVQSKKFYGLFGYARIRKLIKDITRLGCAPVRDPLTLKLVSTYIFCMWMVFCSIFLIL